VSITPFVYCLLALFLVDMELLFFPYTSSQLQYSWYVYNIIASDPFDRCVGSNTIWQSRSSPNSNHIKLACKVRIIPIFVLYWGPISIWGGTWFFPYLSLVYFVAKISYKVGLVIKVGRESQRGCGFNSLE